MKKKILKLYVLKNMKKEKNNCTDCKKYFCSNHGRIDKKCFKCDQN